MSRIIDWLQTHKSETFAWIVAAAAIAFIIYTEAGVRGQASKAWIPAAIIVLVAAYFIWKIRSGATAEDGTSMPVGDRQLLISYLLVLGLMIVFMLVSLNSIDFPEAAVEPEPPIITAPLEPAPTGTPNQSTPGQQQRPLNTTAANQNPAPAANPPPVSPVPTPTPAPFLQAVFPHHTMGKPDESLTLYGQNFQKESKVRFNNKEVASTFVSANLFTAPLQPSNLANVGSITVEIENPGNLLSHAITVPVTKPKVPLNIFFFWYPLITREVQLLLIVLFAGALGSYVHALKSLGDFIGNRTAKASWFWWYITRPFLGMALALIFYAVLRGGFLAGTPADAKIVSAFGVLTVGALVGMFADKATQKLAEVFDVVFKAPDPRSGKLNVPVIDKLDPDTVLIGSEGPLITISGVRLGKVASVRVGSDDRKPDKVSENEITFKLKSDDTLTAKKIAITAVNSDGGVSPSAMLHVSDLVIPDPGTIDDAKVGEAFSKQLNSTGGSGTKKWSLIDAPKWMSIDAATGTLSGTPGPEDQKDLNKVTVKVVDHDGASASKTFNLRVVKK